MINKFNFLIAVTFLLFVCTSSNVLNTSSYENQDCRSLFLEHKNSIEFNPNRKLVLDFKDATGINIYDYMSCVVKLVDEGDEEAMTFFKVFSNTLLSNIIPKETYEENTISISYLLVRLIEEMKSIEGFELGLAFFASNVCTDDLKGHPKVDWSDFVANHRARKNYSSQMFHSVLLKKMTPACGKKYHEKYFELYIKHAQNPEDNCVKGWVEEMSKILYEDYENGKIELLGRE